MKWNESKQLQIQLQLQLQLVLVWFNSTLATARCESLEDPEFG
jgi:hypothetical protein